MIDMAAIGPTTPPGDAPGPAAPVYFGPEGRKLFGWFHAPAGPPTGPVVVICPPLGFSMIMSHRGLRHLAESAAQAGLPTLRFDYHGTGDSAGSDHEPGRVDAWIASVGHAIDEARRLTGAQDVVLIGVRIGSLLASYAAAARSDVAGLVAWAPVASGRAQVREFHAVGQLMSGYEPTPGDIPEGAVVAAGFLFTKESIERLGELDIARLPRAPAPRVLVVPRDDLPDDDKLASALEGLGAEVTRAPLRGFAGMMRDAHATEVPEEAIRGILEWLQGVPAMSGVVAAPPAEPVLRGITSGTGSMGLNPPNLAAAAIEEQPFYAHGGRLFGILARPAAGGTRRPAIILASAGAVHRIGSNRLYVTVARAWAERGFPVLRLDIGGIGDSPPFPGMAENETYSARAVADIGEAAAALRRGCGTSGIVVAGLCSGAHAAFHAALTLQGLVGVIMMNPIVFYWKPSDALDVSAWMTQGEVQRYQKRLTSVDSWKRVLQGKVDVVVALKTVSLWIRDRVAARSQGLRRAVDRLVPSQRIREDAGQDLARICAQGTDVALVFSQGDPGLYHLRLHHAGDLQRLRDRPNFALYEIPWTGHTFTNIRAQQMVVEMLTAHLERRFG